MRTFKIFGFLIASLAVWTVGHYLLPQDLKPGKQEVMNKILSRDYTSAEMLLEQYKVEISKEAFALYLAYIKRGKGEFEASDRALKQAKLFAEEMGEANTLKEARLNLMLNAYLEQSERRLLQEISDGEKDLDGENHWQDLFRGLTAFHHKNYPKANAYFKKSRGGEFFSPLMRADFEKYLSNDEILLFQIRSEIEIGELFDARRSLQPLYQSASDEERKELHFLMGLTYFREAESMSVEEAVPYYRMAFDQFLLSSILSDQHLSEKTQIAKKIEENLNEILQKNSFSSFDFFYRFLITLGEKGGGEKIKFKVLEQIDASFASGDSARGQILTVLLNKITQNENERDRISNRFWGQFEASLNKGDLSSASRKFEAAKMFCRAPCFEIERHAEEVVKMMIANTKTGSLQIRQIEAYLSLLSEMQTNRKEWLAVENLLIRSLQGMWKTKSNRDLAISLFTIIKQSPIALNSSYFQINLEHAFDLERNAAIKRGNLEDLHDLWFAKESLELAFLDWNPATDAKNWIVEAESLYEKKKYKESREKALLVLKVDPENIDAKKLLGLIAYHKGEYSLSYDYLKNIPQKEVNVVRKMAVLEMLFGREETGNKLFAKLKEKGIFTPDIYLEIAFASLSEGKPEIAMKWLQKADPKLPEVAAARCFASFEMSSWKETITLFEALPKKYQRLDGFQGIAIESYFSLGNVAEGEKLLGSLLKMPPTGPSSDFPEYVQIFIQNKLSDWNRYYVAATYYKVVKKDPQKALEYYNKIENPSFLAQMEKGELYLQLGDPNDARVIFIKLLSEIKGEDQEKTIKKRLLPLLGASFIKLGYYYDAVPYYNEYIALGKPEDQYLASYAKVLMLVKRYDLALQQFEEMKSKSRLSNDNMVDLIECLVRTNQFQKAEVQARDWLSREGVPLIFQIKAYRYLIITKNKAITDPIFAAIAEKEVKSLEENEQLILLKMELGDYNQALNLSDTFRRGLESTQRGLMVLAKLYSKLSDEQNALNFAESALNFDQGNLSILTFIEKLDHNPENLARKIKDLNEMLGKEPGNVTIQLGICMNLINLSIEMAASGALKEIKQSPDLQEARSMLDNLEKNHKEFPELYFLLGKTYYLQDEDEKAEAFYQTALKQDPSYVEALRYIALIYEGRNDLKKALESMKEAVKFDPSNAEIWLQLAGLYSKEDALAEAIVSLKNAIKFAPNASDPYIRISEVYLEIKNPEFAIENLKIALQLSPKNIEALELMILTLYDQNFTESVKDASDLEKVRLRYFDKLQALDPEEAKGLRKRLGIKEE